jgi:hypothetical protein
MYNHADFRNEKKKEEEKIIIKDPGKSFMALSYRENMKIKSEILLSLYEVAKNTLFWATLHFRRKLVQ